jgi:RIO-like serine/threonine protein kinase
MPPAPDLSVLLELSRTTAPQDPYAFRFEPQTYTLRTPGGGRLVLEIDWSAELLADLEAVRRPDRDPVVVQRLGEAMARFLERASWSARAQAIVEALDAGRRVVVTIRSNAAELYALPWELVVLPGRGRHLGSLPGVLLRYERPETRTAAEAPAPRPEGGRILFAWSAAAGAVPAADHEAALRRACAHGHPEGEAAIEVLPHATVRRLADALTQARRANRPFSVIHLLCHGGRAGQAFGLVLDGEGRPATVTADTWRTLLAPYAGSLRLIVIAACEGGHAGEPGNHLGSVAQAVHAAGLEAVVASRYPLSRTGSITLAEALYEQLLREHASLEEALLHTREQLALDPGHLDWAALQLHARADDGNDTRPFVFRPYRGLLAFEAAQAAFFYGREAEREETVGDLEALVRAGKPRFLVVAGASGTGKSSLVRAGAVPDILATRGGAWEHAIIRPGTDPLGTLEAALCGRVDPARPLLLVVDQFEEIFTHTKDREVRVAFARRLWAVAREDTHVACILSLRVDFLGRCGELRLDEAGTRLDAIAYDEAHRVFVAQMAPAQLLAAITRPAERVGLVLQEGLAERIVAEVGMEPGALPLMQYTLDLMWQARRGRTLAVDVYEALGGIVGSLERRADALLEELQDEELHEARRMLTQLVGLGDDDTGDTRRRVPVDMLWPDDPRARTVAQTVLRRFVDERLLVRDDRTQGGATVEIAHEALIRRWDRLREWLHDERERRIGRYIVLECLRQGRRGESYLGYDPELDRRVTIKLLRVGRRGAEERVRMRDQARALARLSHPNVLAVYDVGVAQGHVYMAMEQVESVPLRVWAAERPRAWGEVVAVFVQVADALAAAHRLGLVHRAFGPEAVIVGEDATPRVCDFALDRHTEVTDTGRSAGTLAARLQARVSAGSGPIALDTESSLAADASIVASLTDSSVASSSAYAAPELLRGQAAGPAGDQFAFCVAFYELLHGERPFEGDAMAAFVQSLGSRERMSAPKRVIIPDPLRRLLLRGLAAEPEERWPSMEALRDELRRVAEPPRRRRLVGAVALAGVAAVGAGLVWLGGRDDAASQPEEHEAHAELGELHERLAEDAASLVELAEAALAEGRPAVARRHAELAVSIEERVASDSAELATARFVLARSLWSDPAQHARARALAEQARAERAALGNDGVAEIDEWLAMHR